MVKLSIFLVIEVLIGSRYLVLCRDECPKASAILPCTCDEIEAGLNISCRGVKNGTELKAIFHKMDGTIRRLQLLDVDYRVPEMLLGEDLKLSPKSDVLIECKQSNYSNFVHYNALPNQVGREITIRYCLFWDLYSDVSITSQFQRVRLESLESSYLYRLSDLSNITNHIRITNVTLARYNTWTMFKLQNLTTLEVTDCTFYDFVPLMPMPSLGTLHFTRVLFNESNVAFLKPLSGLKTVVFNVCEFPGYNSSKKLLDASLQRTGAIAAKQSYRFTEQSPKKDNIIDATDLSLLPSLELLDLSGSIFTGWIFDGVIDGLDLLRINNYPLDWQNLLDVLDEVVVAHNVTSLELENSGLKMVPGQINSFLTLRNISLQGNGIEILPKGSFVVNPQLQEINLGENPLHKIEAQAIQGDVSANLKLRLHGTRMKTLEENVFSELLPKLKEVDLTDVSLECGCDIAWLVVNQSHLISRLTNAACSSSGVPLQSLDPSTFNHCFDVATIPPTPTTFSWAACPSICFDEYEPGYCWEGNDAVEEKPCPKSSDTLATWECSNGAWVTPRPDFSRCSLLDHIIREAMDKLNGSSNIPSVVNSLSAVTVKSQIIAGDLQNIGHFLELAMEANEIALLSEPDEAIRFKMAKEFTASIAHLAEVTLEQQEGWWGMNMSLRTITFSRYLDVFESTVLQLSQSMPNSTATTSQVITAANLVFRADKVLLSQSLTYGIVLGNSEANVSLLTETPGALSQLDLISVSIGSAADILYGDVTERWSLGIQTGVAIGPIERLNSPILSISITDSEYNDTYIDSVTLRLPKAIRTGPFDTIVHRTVWYQNMSERNAECIDWVPLTKSKSTAGCYILDDASTEDRYVCRCNTTARFTVRSTQENIVLQKFPLKLITMCGGVISSAALATGIILSFWSPTVSQSPGCLSGDRQAVKIHVNLYFNLLAAQIIYLAGLETVEPGQRPACLAIAFLLHFLYLTTFAWMVREGLYIYDKIVLVFPNSRKLERCGLRVPNLFNLSPPKLAVLSYGLPLVIVCVSFFSTYTKDYVSSQSCWVGNREAVIGGFAVPIGAGIIFNATVLGRTLTIALKNKLKPKQNKHTQQQNKNVARIVVTALFLCFLLGITWIFTILYVLQASVELAYLFTIFNSTQGIVIFCYVFIYDEGSRKAIQKKLFTTRSHPNEKQTTISVTQTPSFTPPNIHTNTNW